jgi:hypothetical protein
MGGMQGQPGMSSPDLMGGASGMNQGYGQQGQQQPPQGYPAQQQGYAAHGGYSNANAAAGSGGFTALGSNPQVPGPGMPGALGPSMPPGGYGSMTPQGGMQHPNGAPGGKPDLATTLKTHAIKIIGGTLLFVGAILFLIDTDEAPAPTKKNNVASVDGGSADAGTSSGTAVGGGGTGTAPTAPPVMQQQTPTAPAWPAGVPCPPPNWPPNTPLPCTPNDVRTPPDKPTPDRGTKDAGKASEPKDAGAPLAPGAKTLARQAVDAVASGDTARAAAAYEELARRDPNDKVFAEAARILRAKLDGGVPGQ